MMSGEARHRPRRCARTVYGVAAGDRSIARVHNLTTSKTAALAAPTRTVGRATRREECWRVDWRLVLEDGQWKRESASQVSERC